MSFPFPSYRFDEIEQAPSRPGIYAWYHEVVLTNADVDQLIQQLKGLEVDARPPVIESYLRDRVFGPYRETPYAVSLRGGLKPEYGGQIGHQPRVSPLTVETLAKDPTRIREMRSLLRNMVPVFASPIYIGVATVSLRARLLQHQKSINEYRETPTASIPNDEEHSFAYEVVCERALSPLELIVYTMETPVSREMQLAAEYIFNRINYPLCGRR